MKTDGVEGSSTAQDVHVGHASPQQATSTLDVGEQRITNARLAPKTPEFRKGALFVNTTPPMSAGLVPSSLLKSQTSSPLRVPCLTPPPLLSLGNLSPVPD